jgi:hypothetical protein
MRIPKLLDNRSKFLITITLVGCLSLVACSVDVKKGDQGEGKKVDIKTPVGDLHVGNDVDVHDTGLPVYPGARKKEKKEDGEENGANVNIATSFFGVKVVAVEYLSDDPPSKVVEYYKDQLKKKFGNVLECHTTKHGDNFDIHQDDDESDGLKCEEKSGNNIELKVGTRENQHIVAIEPKDKGTDFGLVYVQTRGKPGSI